MNEWERWKGMKNLFNLLVTHIESNENLLYTIYPIYLYIDINYIWHLSFVKTTENWKLIFYMLLGNTLTRHCCNTVWVKTESIVRCETVAKVGLAWLEGIICSNITRPLSVCVTTILYIRFPCWTFPSIHCRKSIQDIEWDNCTTDDKSVDEAIKTSFSPVKVFLLIPSLIAP